MLSFYICIASETPLAWIQWSPSKSQTTGMSLSCFLLPKKSEPQLLPVLVVCAPGASGRSKPAHLQNPPPSSPPPPLCSQVEAGFSPNSVHERFAACVKFTIKHKITWEGLHPPTPAVPEKLDWRMLLRHRYPAITYSEESKINEDVIQVEFTPEKFLRHENFRK